MQTILPTVSDGFVFTVTQLLNEAPKSYWPETLKTRSHESSRLFDNLTSYHLKNVSIDLTSLIPLEHIHQFFFFSLPLYFNIRPLRVRIAWSAVTWPSPAFICQVAPPAPWLFLDLSTQQHSYIEKRYPTSPLTSDLWPLAEVSYSAKCVGFFFQLHYAGYTLYGIFRIEQITELCKCAAAAQENPVTDIATLLWSINNLPYQFQLAILVH